MTAPLATFETGARVRRLDAQPVDYAFRRVGTVIRETVDGAELVGILWDGWDAAIEYPDDQPFESVAANEFICALCGGTFEKGWTEEEARAEFAQVWKKEFREQGNAVVCDPCYERMKRWKTPAQFQAEQRAKRGKR